MEEKPQRTRRDTKKSKRLEFITWLHSSSSRSLSHSLRKLPRDGRETTKDMKGHKGKQGIGIHHLAAFKFIEIPLSLPAGVPSGWKRNHKGHEGTQREARDWNSSLGLRGLARDVFNANY
jgi:hypothetical protein